MWSFIAFLSVLCFVLLYLLNSQFIKRTKLLEDYSELKAYQKLAEEKHPEVQEDLQPGQKPLSLESIRTALRFNGLSPEIPDTHEPGIVYFLIGDTKYRIYANNLPYLSIEVGYSLNNESPNDITLMYQAASDITAQMFIGKAHITGDAEAIIFSVEILCDSYMHLRNNIKRYLDILSEVSRLFYEAHETLKEQREEERKAVFSGNSFVPGPAANHKVLS